MAERPRLLARVLSWADRFVNWVSALAGLGVVTVGGLTAWAARAAQLLAEYSPFSWVAAGILGAALMALILWALASVRLNWAQATATEKWKERVDTINPLEDTFRGQRIRLADLVSPVTGEIGDKTFVDCELLGPINLAVMASQPGSGSMQHVSFYSCDWVVTREGAKLFNAVALRDCNLLRGKVHKVTFFMPSAAALKMVEAAQGPPQWVTQPPIPQGEGS